jgi:hypothetical protein
MRSHFVKGNSDYYNHDHNQAMEKFKKDLMSGKEISSSSPSFGKFGSVKPPETKIGKYLENSICTSSQKISDQKFSGSISSSSTSVSTSTQTMDYEELQFIRPSQLTSC